jgi:hypothetical protein
MANQDICFATPLRECAGAQSQFCTIEVIFFETRQGQIYRLFIVMKYPFKANSAQYTVKANVAARQKLLAVSLPLGLDNGHANRSLQVVLRFATQVLEPKIKYATTFSLDHNILHKQSISNDGHALLRKSC